MSALGAVSTAACSLSSSVFSLSASSSPAHSSNNQPSNANLSSPPQFQPQLAYDKVPLCTLVLRIPYLYLMSRDDHALSSTSREALIPFKVRIVGSVHAAMDHTSLDTNQSAASLTAIEAAYRARAGREIYLVAKDLCALIHSQKGNVAKSTHGFAEWEKARIAVLCPRVDGSTSTHILTVLPVAGMYKLLHMSRSLLASSIMAVLYEVINSLFVEREECGNKIGIAVTGASARAAARTMDERSLRSTEEMSPRTVAEVSTACLAPVNAVIVSTNHPLPFITSDTVQVTTLSNKRRHCHLERGNHDDHGKVTGPIVVYTLVPTAHSIGFVRTMPNDIHSTRGVVISCDVANRDHQRETKQNRLESSSRRAFPVRSQVVASAAVSNDGGYERCTPAQVDSERGGWEPRREQASPTANESLYLPSLAFNLPQGVLFNQPMPTLLSHLPTAPPSIPMQLLASDVPTSPPQQPWYQSLDFEQQQLQLLVQQQQQQRSLDEMIMYMRHQQQQQFLREQQKLQQLAFDAHNGNALR